MIIFRFLHDIYLFAWIILFLKTSVLLGQTPIKHNIKIDLIHDLDTLGLKTGDMVFVQSTTFNGKMIQFGTVSPFTHSAMIVVADNGDILLTHATNNDYNGYMLPVLEEKHSRKGIILTKLESLFLSTDGGKTGFYKHIWIRRLNESKITRPKTSKLLKLYSKYKSHPFETSNIVFFFSALDVFIGKKDIFKNSEDKKYMCSEYISHLFIELNFPVIPKEPPCETTPVDIYNILGEYYDPPIVFGFKDGFYHIINTN